MNSNGIWKKVICFVNVFAFTCTIGSIYGQQIRKDYREMTNDEKAAYVNVLHGLWDDDVITSFVNIHTNNMNVAHGNERFLPWHRLFLQDFEQELQQEYPQLAIPYWDWTEDRSTNPNWTDNNFLGQFDDEWGLDRCLGCSGVLPTQNQVTSVLTLSNFSSGGSGNGFGGGQGGMMTNPAYGDLELIHNFPHGWVGGDMSIVATSPRDPIFFLHHSFVDMLWQKWNGNSIFSSSSLNMSPYGNLNPHNIVDSRSLKVWYAEDGEVLLDQYDTNGTEEYRYTGIIKAKDNFVVKNGSNVTFTAGEAIVLGPGFQVETGSTFYASVDPNVGNILAKQRGDSEEPLFEEKSTPATYSLSQNYPNPFNPVTVIRYEIPVSSHVELAIFDVLGRRIATLVDGQVSLGQHEVRFDASNLSSGIYIYRIKANNFVETRQMTLIK